MSKIFILMKRETRVNCEYEDSVHTTPILTSFDKNEIVYHCTQMNEDVKQKNSEKNKWYNLFNTFGFTPKHKIISDHHIKKSKLIPPVYVEPIRHPNIPDDGYARICNVAKLKHDKDMAAHLEYMNSINGTNEKINQIEFEKAKNDFIVENKIPKDIAIKWIACGSGVFCEDIDQVEYVMESCEHSD